jgi:hypothetical protein
MFASHGDFKMGQVPSELSSDALTRQPTEFATDHNDRTKSKDFVNALTMSGYETGMVTLKSKAEAVEFNPNDGTWPPEFANVKMRLKCGDMYVYTNECDGCLGLGAPAQLGRGDVSLTKKDANGRSGEQALEEKGLLVHAQQHLHLPKAEQAQVVAVIGDGATGAWACQASIEKGAKKVYWYGAAPKAEADPAAVAEMMSQFGLSEAEAQTYARAYNKRNANVFQMIKEGKVILVGSFKDAAEIEAGKPDAGKVQITGGGNPVVDGIISAIGSTPKLPAGMEKMKFQLVIATDPKTNKERLVALAAVDEHGVPNGLTIKGPLMVTRQVADMVLDAQKGMYKQLLDEQNAPDANVPEGSRGVPGSVYQTGQNMIGANANPTAHILPATTPAATTTPVTTTPVTTTANTTTPVVNQTPTVDDTKLN